MKYVVIFLSVVLLFIACIPPVADKRDQQQQSEYNFIPNKKEKMDSIVTLLSRKEKDGCWDTHPQNDSMQWIKICFEKTSDNHKGEYGKLSISYFWKIKSEIWDVYIYDLGSDFTPASDDGSLIDHGFMSGGSHRLLSHHEIMSMLDFAHDALK